MTWLGKVVGGAVGFIMGGPLGAVLGAAVGHQIDRNTDDMRLLESEFAPGAQQRVQMAFFTATFSIMGHIAKSDGRVTTEEIAAARNIMGRMELSENLRKTAIKLFTEGKRPDFPFDATIDQFRAECHRRFSLFRVFVEIQLEAALADGALRDQEEQLLLRVCERLHFSRFEFFALQARMEAERRFARSGRRDQRHDRQGVPLRDEPSLADAYAVLGLAPSASDDDVKRTYRRLMSQHHPDKLVAKGLPEEMVRIATGKTQRIRKAFEAIAKTRKF
jgi:DnaJ like chaperone protein